MVGQFAIPLVIVVRHLAWFDCLFGKFAFAPAFGAGQLIRFAGIVGFVPGGEQLARVAALWLATTGRTLALGCHLLFLIFRRFRFRLQLFYRFVVRRDRLEQGINAIGGEQTVG